MDRRRGRFARRRSVEPDGHRARLVGIRYHAILSTLGFAWLARAGPVLSGLALAHGLEYFTIGLGTAAFTAYIASTTDRRYTATQFALFTSLAAVPRTFINA